MELFINPQNWVLTTGLIPGEEEFVAGLQADPWGILSPTRMVAARKDEDLAESEEAETGH